MDPVSSRPRHKYETSGINDNGAYNLMGRSTKDVRVSQDRRTTDSPLSRFTNGYDDGPSTRSKKQEDKSHEIEPTIPENISNKIKQIGLGKINESQIKKRLLLTEQSKNRKCREPIKAFHPMINGKTYQIHASRDNVYKGSVKINQYKIQGMCQSPRPSHVADKYLGFSSFRKIVPKHEDSFVDTSKTNLKRFAHVMSDDPNLKRLESVGDLGNHFRDSGISKSHTHTHTNTNANTKLKKIVIKTANHGNAKCDDTTSLNKLPKQSKPTVANKNCIFGNSSKLNERNQKITNIKSDIVINKELGKKIPKDMSNHKKVKNDPVQIRESARKTKRQASFDSMTSLQDTISTESALQMATTGSELTLAEFMNEDKRRNENMNKNKYEKNAKHEKENSQVCDNKEKKQQAMKAAMLRRGLSEVRPSIKNCVNILQPEVLSSDSRRGVSQNNEEFARSRKSIWTKQENDKRIDCKVARPTNSKDGSGEIFRDGIKKRGYSEERFDRKLNLVANSSDADTDVTTQDCNNHFMKTSQNKSNFLKDCHYMRTNELYMELMACRRKRNLIKPYVRYDEDVSDVKMKMENSPYFKAETVLNESPYHNNFTKIIDDPVKVKIIKSLVDSANKKIEKKKKPDATKEKEKEKETTESTNKREKEKDAILVSRTSIDTMSAYIEESRQFQTINIEEEEHETLQKLEHLNDTGNVTTNANASIKQVQSKFLPIYRNPSKYRNTLDKSSGNRNSFKPRNYSSSHDSVVNDNASSIAVRNKFLSERASSNRTANRTSAEKLTSVCTFDKPLSKNIVSIIDSRIYQVDNNLKQEKGSEIGLEKASKINEPLIKNSTEKTVISEKPNKNSSKTRITSKKKHCSNLLDLLPTGGLPTDNSENYTKLKQREISMAKPVS